MMHQLRWTAARTLGLALAVMVAVAGPTRGDALKTYVFEGTVDQVDNSTGFFDSSIQVGSPFKMTVVLPADTPNRLGDNPNFGHYAFPTGTPGSGISLTIDGQPFVTGAAQEGEVGVTVSGGSGDLFYGHQTFAPAGAADIDSTRLDFDLLANGKVLAGDALPDTLNLADFSASARFFLPVFYKDNRAYPSIGGAITSVAVVGDPGAGQGQPIQSPGEPVPEPGTGMAFGLVLSAYLVLRRRR
jgi:hypothetical protein